MPPKILAEETKSVRLPKGTADKLRAATGQPFSRVVRWAVMTLLAKYEAEGAQRLTSNAKEVGEAISQNTEKM